MYNNREYQKTYISTQTTTAVFTGRGVLGGININTAAGTITVQDGGVTFAIIAATMTGTQLSDVVISNGLTIITGGAADITVKWAKG